jgi:hypothetical protein
MTFTSAQNSILTLPELDCSAPAIAATVARQRVDRAELRRVLGRRRSVGLGLRHARRLRLLADRAMGVESVNNPSPGEVPPCP